MVCAAVRSEKPRPFDLEDGDALRGEASPLELIVAAADATAALLLGSFAPQKRRALGS